MIHTVWNSLPVLAARQGLPSVWGRFDHQRPGHDANHLLIMACGAALVVVAALIWYFVSRRANRHFVSNSPARLFGELSRAHGLSFSSRRLLKRLAAAHQLASPALLFVEPAYFHPSRLPPDLAPAANELQRLHNHLFK